MRRNSRRGSAVAQRLILGKAALRGSILSKLRGDMVFHGRAPPRGIPSSGSVVLECHLIWGGPSVETDGILGGDAGKATKTVLPAQAHAKIGCRLIANQTPNAVFGPLKYCCRTNCRQGTAPNDGFCRASVHVGMVACATLPERLG